MRTLQILCATAMALIIMAPVAARAERAGIISAASGETQVLPNGEKNWRELEAKGTVDEGDVIKTGQRSRLKILMNDDSVLTLGPNSTLKISAYVVKKNPARRQSTLRLLTGRLRSVVSKFFGGDDDNFSVETPTAVAGVRGTSFIVDATDSQKTRVVVLEGQVSVLNALDKAAGEVVLSSGRMSDVFSGQAPSLPQMAPDSLIKELMVDTEVKMKVSKRVKSGGAPSGAINRAEKGPEGGDGGAGGGGANPGSRLDAATGQQGGAGGAPPINQTPPIPDGFGGARVRFNFPGK